MTNADNVYASTWYDRRYHAVPHDRIRSLCGLSLGLPRNGAMPFGLRVEHETEGMLCGPCVKEYLAHIDSSEER
jgi:hypothetical protein